MPITILRQAFSLNESGGIYFDGERIDSANDTIRLFVGIGGMGNETLIRVKNQVLNRIKLPVDETTGMPLGIPPKNFAFISVDTSESDIRGRHYSNTTFSDDEILSIGPSNGENYASIIANMQNHKATGQKYADFLPDSGSLGTAGAAPAAGARRLMGRVAFFSKAQRIRNKITTVLNKLKAENAGYKRVQIFLFGGISGGTGSGTFLDMGYILKTISPESELLGYFYMPDLNDRDPGDQNGREANAFAALKELDWMFERGMSDSKNTTTIYKYGTSAVDEINARRPFDYCHIINKTDTAQNVKAKEDIIMSVAESVFTYSADEAGTGKDFVPGFVSLYENINAFLSGNETRASYPASYKYLSPSSSSLKIPYMEISTLIACRMFQSLETKVFSNAVTGDSLDADMLSLGLGGGRSNFQDSMAAILEEHAPSAMQSDFIYDDIRSGKAWSEAFNNTQQYRNAIDACYGTLAGNDANAGRLEGQLKEFLKTAIVRMDRGPKYLKNLISGSEGTDNLIGLFTQQKKYFNDISNQEYQKAQKAKKDCEDMLAESEIGSINFIKRKNYVSEYMECLATWNREQKLTDKYAYLAKVCGKLIQIYKKYYDNILAPLNDNLDDLIIIFRDNLRILTVREDELRRKPDPSIIISPFKFEEKYQTQFADCVRTATNGFLNMMYNSMKRWIGRDMDHVDAETANVYDIPGELSKFISDCFRTLYNTLTMESILSAKAPTGMPLADYAKSLIRNMYNASYPMFDKNALPADGTTEDYTLIAVPTNCPNIISAAQALKEENPTEIIVKQSLELNRISLVKVATGFALINNRNINHLERQYESFAQNDATRAYLHIYYGWREYLPSPNVQTVWSNDYTCESTVTRNDKYRKMFKRCYDNDLIVLQEDANTASLKIGDSTYNLELVQLQGTIAQKEAQLERIKNAIWNPVNPSTLLLPGKGTYSDGGKYFASSAIVESDAGKLRNIMENVIRDTDICDALERECERLEFIEKFERSIKDPQIYMRAWICGMFELDKITNDVFIRATKQSPMAKQLLDCTIDIHKPSDEDYYYVVYSAFAPNMDKLAAGDQTWNQAVEINWQAHLRAMNDSEVNERTKKKIQGFLNVFRKNATYYANEEGLAVDKAERRKYNEIKEFYLMCVEVLSRI